MNTITLHACSRRPLGYSFVLCCPRDLSRVAREPPYVLLQDSKTGFQAHTSRLARRTKFSSPEAVMTEKYAPGYARDIRSTRNLAHETLYRL